MNFPGYNPRSPQYENRYSSKYDDSPCDESTESSGTPNHGETTPIYAPSTPEYSNSRNESPEPSGHSTPRTPSYEKDEDGNMKSPGYYGSPNLEQSSDDGRGERQPGRSRSRTPRSRSRTSHSRSPSPCSRTRASRYWSPSPVMDESEEREFSDKMHRMRHVGVCEAYHMVRFRPKSPLPQWRTHYPCLGAPSESQPSSSILDPVQQAPSEAQLPPVAGRNADLEAERFQEDYSSPGRRMQNEEGGTSGSLRRRIGQHEDNDSEVRHRGDSSASNASNMIEEEEEGKIHHWDREKEEQALKERKRREEQNGERHRLPERRDSREAEERRPRRHGEWEQEKRTKEDREERKKQQALREQEHGRYAEREELQYAEQRRRHQRHEDEKLRKAEMRAATRKRKNEEHQMKAYRRNMETDRRRQEDSLGITEVRRNQEEKWQSSHKKRRTQDHGHSSQQQEPPRSRRLNSPGSHRKTPTETSNKNKREVETKWPREYREDTVYEGDSDASDVTTPSNVSEREARRNQKYHFTKHPRYANGTSQERLLIERYNGNIEFFEDYPSRQSEGTRPRDRSGRRRTHHQDPHTSSSSMPKSSRSHQGVVSRRRSIQRDHMGWIIGKQGANIKRLQKESGAEIELNNYNGVMTISGSREQVKKASQMVDESLEKHKTVNRQRK